MRVVLAGPLRVHRLAAAVLVAHLERVLHVCISAQSCVRRVFSDYLLCRTGEAHGDRGGEEAVSELMSTCTLTRSLHCYAPALPQPHIPLWQCLYITVLISLVSRGARGVHGACLVCRCGWFAEKRMCIGR